LHGLESRLRDHQRVEARVRGSHLEVAAVVGVIFAGYCSALVNQVDLGAGNDGAGTIGNDATHGSGSLGHGSGWFGGESASERSEGKRERMEDSASIRADKPMTNISRQFNV
jgi:hypothetical protein